jgi:Flp pilus assembly pilin Flp
MGVDAVPRGSLFMRWLPRRPSLDSAGATAIEYAMVAFFISIAAFSALVTVGTSVSSIFQRIATGF